MKVLLVNPPNKKTITSNVPHFLQQKTAYLPPLGLLYIASFVEQQKDYSVKIYDAVIYNTDYTAVARVAKDYDVIGITTTTFTLIDAIETVKAIRRYNATAIIVLGGPHLAIFPQESITIPGVDFVLQGEGKNPLLNWWNY